MKILITGANGFLGRNLTAMLAAVRDGKDKTRGLSNNLELLLCTRETNAKELADYCSKAEFVFHLAGVNRPNDDEEFLTGNRDFTVQLLRMLSERPNPCPVLLASSIQAERDNPYGRSKLAAEAAVRDYGRETGTAVYIYRLPNLFGKWCRPHYNSVVATFCHQIARALPIQVNDLKTVLTLCYVDDVLDEFCRALQGNATWDASYCTVPVTHTVSLEEIVCLLEQFRCQPQTLVMPELPQGSFAKKLYSTYLSYLPKEAIAFPLTMHRDDRGSFTELMRTLSCGQFSVNISKPGVTKGQHWHHSKWEFFMVVHGHGLIQQRQLGREEVLEFEVSGEQIQAVHMLPGYTHNLINLSDHEDLVTVMWANEPFDAAKPDTFYEEV